MFKTVTAIILSISLMGCETISQFTFDETTSHPDLPVAVEPYNFDWNVITDKNKDEKVIGNKIFIAIEYDESLLFRKFLEDMKRYMLESGQVMCYYREELDEDFCKNQNKFLKGE